MIYKDNLSGMETFQCKGHSVSLSYHGTDEKLIEKVRQFMSDKVDRQKSDRKRKMPND